MPNNPDLVPISINFSCQQFIVAIANNAFTIDAPTFANPMGEVFRVLKLEFSMNSSEKDLQFATFSR
jgi:hypothetical protein